MPALHTHPLGSCCQSRPPVTPVRGLCSVVPGWTRKDVAEAAETPGDPNSLWLLPNSPWLPAALELKAAVCSQEFSESLRTPWADPSYRVLTR